MQDSDTELLTAFVDGELGRREHKAVLRLLHSSSEARALLWQLRENAVAVRQLPAKRAPADCAARVMQAIEHAAVAASTTPAAASARTAPVRSRRKFLARFAMAAAVLLAVGGVVAYFASRGPRDEDNSPSIAFNNEQPTPPEPNAGKDTGKPAAGYFALRELKDKAHVKALTAVLDKPSGDRLELAVSNSTKAVHKISTLLQNQGFRVVTDASAQGKNAKGSDFWVFAENATPEELATLLHRAGSDDTFEGVQIAAMSNDDCNNVAKVLGVDVDQVRNPRELPKLLDPIIEAPGSAKKLPAQAAVQGRSHEGLVLIVAAGSQPSSSQVKDFLRQRRRLQPGTVQALLVVRQI